MDIISFAVVLNSALSICGPNLNTDYLSTRERLFLDKTINENFVHENETFHFQSSKRIINIDDNRIGYSIEYLTENERPGYILAFEHNSFVKIYEMNDEIFSPYHGYEDCICLYSNNLGYYYVEDSLIREIDLTNHVDYNNISTGQSGVGFAQVEYNNFAYTRAEVEEYYDNIDVYEYSSSIANDLYNHCGPTAGTMVLDYYNRKSNNDVLNLLPNQMEQDGHMTNDTANSYIHILYGYNYMWTNLFFGLGGTIQTQYRFGIESLFSQHGYILGDDIYLDSFYSHAKSVIDSDNILTVYSQEYRLRDYYFVDDLNFTTGNHTSSNAFTHYYGQSYWHYMVGCGYLTVKYYRQYDMGEMTGIVIPGFDGAQFVEYLYKTERYIRVATGWGYPAYLLLENPSCYEGWTGSYELYGHSIQEVV